MFGRDKNWVLPGIALLTTLLIGLFTSWWIGGESAAIWANFDLAKAGMEAEYCELNRMTEAVRQPVNAWSNLCYTFLGIWTLGWAWQDFRQPKGLNPQRRNPAMSMWVGLMLVGLGFGSFFFHASLTLVGQHFDMAFTYGLTSSLGVGAAYRLYVFNPSRETSQTKWLFFGLAVLLFVTMAVLKWRINAKIALPVMMLSGIGMAVAVYFRGKPRLSGKLVSLGIISTVTAAVFRTVGVSKIGCVAEGIYQSHAIWHFTTGLAAFLFLAFLRFESADNASISPSAQP